MKRRRRSHRKRNRQRLASPRQNAQATTKEEARRLVRRAILLVRIIARAVRLPSNISRIL
jgi:hypothetical protein